MQMILYYVDMDLLQDKSGIDYGKAFTFIVGHWPQTLA